MTGPYTREPAPHLTEALAAHVDPLHGCTCDPHHIDTGGYDPGCPTHDPTVQEPPC